MMAGLVEMCEYMKARKVELGIMWEIGSYAGESAEVFARYFATVHCADPWDFIDKEIEGSFDERAQAAGNVFKHKGFSLVEVLPVADESLDFAYIDGDHSYEAALADIKAWWPKIKPGAFLGGHDYVSFVGVKQAVASFFRREADRVFSDESWICRKPRPARSLPLPSIDVERAMRWHHVRDRLVRGGKRRGILALFPHRALRRPMGF
jgi:hypothetical protein